MDLSGKHFIYDGINSRRYNLRCLQINTEVIKKISGTPTYQKNFYSNNKSNVITGLKWDESPIITEIEFITDKPIKKSEKREIEKWLFNRPEYCKLYVDKREDDYIEFINGEEKQFYINCVFYGAEVIEFASGIYGFKATIEMASAYALQDEITYSYSGSGDSLKTELTININSDLDDYIYPIIEIKTPTEDEVDSEKQDFVIKNNKGGITQYKFDEETQQIETIIIPNDMTIESIGNNSIITIDCSKGTVACTQQGIVLNYFNKIVDLKFLKLVNGENKITITGEFESISITYQQLRWLR